MIDVEKNRIKNHALQQQQQQRIYKKKKNDFFLMEERRLELCIIVGLKATGFYLVLYSIALRVLFLSTRNIYFNDELNLT